MLTPIAGFGKVSTNKKDILIAAGVKLEPGWPCEGPLLRLAEDAATRLLPAFDTPTG